MSDGTDTTKTTGEVKPGWKTSEFWLAFAANLVGAAFASGVVGEGTVWGKLLGLAAMVLSTLGYTVSRTLVKK